MPPVTERSPSVCAVRHVGGRRLEISSLNLACCAVEAAAALTALDPGESESPSDIPLHVLVVAGTVTKANSHLVTDAFELLAEPRAVVAFGVCTISGGPYWDSYAVLPGIGELVPVDVFVPGCPPQPADLVAALDELAQR